jgi:hypothetical protein
MKMQGQIEFSSVQIIYYFAFIGNFYYLFIQSTAESLSSLMYEESESLWLQSGSIFTQFVKKTLLPKAVAAIPMFVVLLIIGLGFSIINIVQVFEFVLLLILSHIGYMYLSFNVIWLTRQFHWESYGAFALRFIGMTWNGGYIPFVFMSAFWFDIAMKTPYMILGAPFQILLKAEYFQTLIFYTMLHTIIQILISIIPYKLYKITQRT